MEKIGKELSGFKFIDIGDASYIEYIECIKASRKAFERFRIYESTYLEM